MASNAIGGLVNIITDEIPTKPQHGASGTFTFDLGSAAKESGAARGSALQARRARGR
jgi:outer membrane cobalamin receptor